MSGQIIRQGDVILVSADAVPDGGKELPRVNGRILLALGEQTGHAHAIADLSVKWIEVQGERFLQSDVPFTVQHEEHDAQYVAPGAWWVGVQVEHQREEIRRILD